MSSVTTGTVDPKAMLEAVGLRVTAPRVAVLRVLERHPHAAAEVVARAVRDELGAVSTQAVYDVLAAFTQVGLVRRIEPAGSPARFELRTGDNHHHLVCRVCGRIADVDCALGPAPCLRPSDAQGFALDEAEVVYWGTCPECQHRAAVDPPPSHRTVRGDDPSPERTKRRRKD